MIIRTTRSERIIEQFVTLGKITIDKQIEDCIENLKLIRAKIEDSYQRKSSEISLAVQTKSNF